MLGFDPVNAFNMLLGRFDRFLDLFERLVVACEKEASK